MTKKESIQIDENHGIRVLKGLEGVQENPGMYVGELEVIKLIREIVDNSIDEAAAGFCNKIIVEIRNDESVFVSDNGRSIPVYMRKEEGKSSVEVLLTVLHSGGKFAGGAYSVSAGLHGVGMSVVNALSSKLELTARRDGNINFIRCLDGIPEAELKVIGQSNESGTTVHFWPSKKYFPEFSIDNDLIVNRLQELSYLLPGLTIEYTNELIGYERIFYTDQGIKTFLEEANKSRQRITEVIEVSSKENNIKVDSVFLWNESDETIEFCYTNFVAQPDGGHHLSGFRSAITKVLMNYVPSDMKDSVKADDMMGGLVAIIDVKMPRPRFSSQTKEKLVSPEVRPVVENAIKESFSDYCEKNSAAVKKLIAKIKEAIEAREAALKSKKMAKAGEYDQIAMLPGKFISCRSKNPEKCEVYIVEGQSAAGSAKGARDSEFQAIFPIQGKILNSEKATLNEILSFAELSNLTRVLGVGIGKNFKPEGLRYHKVIIMADADVDGSHIVTLFLTFFFRYMRELIESGNIFIALPPLYMIKYGKTTKYIHNEIALNQYIGTVASEIVDLPGIPKDQVVKILETAFQISESFYSDIDIPSSALEQFLIHHLCSSSSSHNNLESEIDSKFSIVNTDTVCSQNPTISFEERITTIINLENNTWKCYLEGENLIVTDAGGNISTYSCYELLQRYQSVIEKLIPIVGFFNGSYYLAGKRLLSITAFANDIRSIVTKDLYIQRYKGLGEMNPDQLHETALDPNSRHIVQINIANAEDADELITKLMGEDVSMRKQIIKDMARFVRNLDV